MERVQSINPQRIAWCCADHGISVDDLAHELDIPWLNIERVMKGEDGLTFNQLRKIAVPGKRYVESDFNPIIVIPGREAYRVKLLMGMIDQREKTIVFCATQAHALMMRD